MIKKCIIHELLNYIISVLVLWLWTMRWMHDFFGYQIKYIYKLDIPNEFSSGSLSKVLPKPNFIVSLVCGKTTSIIEVNLPSG